MLNIPKEVKDLFKQDSVRKNIRIHFPNGERADITNSNLIAESFSFTESVMSQSEFRFGLCEASMVEFDCFGVENIKGYDIEVSHEIDISSLGEDFIATYGLTSDDVDFPFYSVPYGKFTVSEALRQANRQTRRVTAYGKMLDGFKPNKIELEKQNIKSKLNGSYGINLFHYLYTNLPVDSIIEGATYINRDSTRQKRFQLKDGYEVVILYFLFSRNLPNDIFLPSFFRIKEGATLLSIDSVFEELSNYIYLNFPSMYEEFVLQWNSLYKIDLQNSLSIESEYIEGGLFTIYFDKDGYIDGNTGGFVPTHLYFMIPYYIKLVDSQDNELLGIMFKDRNQMEGQFVSLPYRTVGLSFPLKKDKDGYYRIKDIPYDTFPEYIKEEIELLGKFGKVDRYGDFQMFSINGNNGLVPSNTLVPGSTLVPKSLKGGKYDKKQFSSLWYDDFYTLPYNKVSASYKNTDGEDAYAEYWLVDNEAKWYDASKYQEYSLSENTFIKDGTFTETEITRILETVAQSLIGLKYMPFEMDSIGLPYLEAGDTLLVETSEGNIQTIALNRRIDGIQSLADNLNAN